MNDPESFPAVWQQLDGLLPVIQTFALCVLAGCALILALQVVLLVLNSCTPSERESSVNDAAVPSERERPRRRFARPGFRADAWSRAATSQSPTPW